MSALTIALLTVSLVALLIPMCAMALCAPVDMSGHHMGGGLTTLLDCDAMYLPGDVPLAVLAQVLMLAVFVAFTVLATSATRTVVQPLEAHWLDTEPNPPDDPLQGRLLI